MVAQFYHNRRDPTMHRLEETTKTQRRKDARNIRNLCVLATLWLLNLFQLRAAVGAELGVGGVLGLAIGAGLGGLARATFRAELGVCRYLRVAVIAGYGCRSGC